MPLLTNGDFEQGTTRETSYWTPDGGPYHTQFGEISAPSGWTVWWREGFGDGPEPDQLSGRPEVGIIRLPGFNDPARVKFGASALKSFTFWRRHDMGLYQRVSVTKDTRYKFSIYAHSWFSSCDAKPHDRPYEKDCTTPLDWASCWLTVGIDPTGGTNPYSDNVVWGEERVIYGRYIDTPLAVEAVAKGNAITVFTHSWTTHSLKHCDTYLDGATLEIVGVPLRQYERTYVLYPPDATLSEIQKLTAIHFPYRRTIGGSADDAGIGHPNLTKRTVIVWHPKRWPGGKVALQNFFDTYYPGIDEILWIENGTPSPSGILLWQCDPQWRAYVFGDNNCTSNLCQQGCFITSLAMAQRFYHIDDNATPVTVDAALGSAGYVGCVANWAGQAAHYAKVLRLRITRTTDLAKVKEHLRDGCVMAEVKPTSLEHFVLVTHIIDDRPWMLDPYKNVEGWLEDYYDGVENWRLVSPVTPPSDQQAKIGLHIQSEIGDWRGLSEIVTPVKFLAGIQNCITVLRLNPQAFPIWRQWVPDQGTYLQDKTTGAKRFIDTFRDSMEDVLETIAREMPGIPKPWFGVESLNEIYACYDPSVITLSIPFDRQFIRAMSGYPEIAPLVYVAAVGNVEAPGESPGSQLWPDLLALGRESQAANAAWAYHPYWFANANESGLREPNWQWLAGRWQWMDDYLVQNGIKVHWAMGETGAVGGWHVADTRALARMTLFEGIEPVLPRATINMGASDYKPERVYVTGNSGYVLLPTSGWKSKDCYGGNWQRYENDLLEFNDRVMRWNETHEYRAYGGTIFTTCTFGWDSFHIGETQISRLKNIL